MKPPGRIRLLVVQHKEAMAHEAALRFADAVRRNPAAILGLTGGSTLRAAYEEFVKIYREDRDLDLSEATIFVGEEYVGLGPDDDQSYHYYMEQHLLAPLVAISNRRAFRRENAHFFDGKARNRKAAIRDYVASIRAHGRIDFQLLAIAQNGHFAFAESGVLVTRAISSKLLRKGKLDPSICKRLRDFNELIFDPAISPRELKRLVGCILTLRHQARPRLGDDPELVERLRRARRIYCDEKRRQQDAALLEAAVLENDLNELGARLAREQKVIFYIHDLTPELKRSLSSPLKAQSTHLEEVEFKDESEFFGAPAKIVNPDISTLVDNSKFFDTLQQVPSGTFTLSETICEAHTILLVANGAEKAGAIQRAISEPRTYELSASRLQKHPHTLFVVDEAAACQLPARFLAESPCHLEAPQLACHRRSAIEAPADREAILVSTLYSESSFALDRAAAAQELGKLGDQASSVVVGVLADAIEDTDARVRVNAARALGKLGANASAAAEALIEALKGPDVDQHAVRALAAIGTGAIDNLKKALGHERWKIRSGAARALGRMGNSASEAGDLLRERARKDEKREVQLAASTALRRIGVGAPPDIRRERLPSQEAISLYTRSGWNHAKGLRLTIGMDVRETADRLAVEMIKAIQQWQANPPVSEDVIIHFATGETPMLGYARLAHYLTTWNEPETQKFLAALGVAKNDRDLARRPNMSRVKGLNLDTIFPQPRTAHLAFSKILNDVFDQLGIPKAKRFFLYGDIDPDDPQLQRPMPHDKMCGLMADIDANGFLVEDYLNGELSLAQNPIQYEFLDAYSRYVDEMTLQIETWRGAHIVIAGVGPSYDGKGHVAFMERGTPFEQTTFFGPLSYHMAAAHSKDNGGIDRLHTASGKLKYGFLTYGWHEILYRKKNGDSEGVTAIVMATGNPKSSSVQRAIEGHRDREYQVSGFQMCDGVFVMDRTAAGALRLFQHPWEFEPVGDRAEQDRLLIGLAKGRRTKIQDLRPSDIEPDLSYYGGKNPSVDGKIRATAIQNLENIVRQDWGKVLEKTARGLADNLARPMDTSERLGLAGTASIVLVNPHMDDDFLAYRDLLATWAGEGHTITAYYLTKGFTAVSDTYAKRALGHMQQWPSEAVRRLRRFLSVSQPNKIALNQAISQVEPQAPDREAILEQAFQENVLNPLRTKMAPFQEKLLQRLNDILKSEDLHKDPRDNDAWEHMGGEEQEIRGQLAYLLLNLHFIERLVGRLVRHGEEVPHRRFGDATLNTPDKIDAFVDWVFATFEKKPSWGSADLEVVQDIKTDLRFIETQSALMSLDVEFSRIHYPFSSTWYCPEFVRGTAEVSDINLLKQAFRKDKPGLIVVNGEGFPDYSAHSTTEAATISAIRDLREESDTNTDPGLEFLDDLKILQYAGVWERIPIEDAGLSVVLSADQMREFDRGFRSHYPSQSPAPVPDPAVSGFQYFSTQVMGNARTTRDEVFALIDIPEQYRTILKERDSGLLNYKILDIAKPDVLEAFQRKHIEMDRVRKVLNAVRGAEIHGPVPRVDPAELGKENAKVEECGLSWDALLGESEFAAAVELGVWSLQRLSPSLSRIYAQHARRRRGPENRS